MEAAAEGGALALGEKTSALAGELETAEGAPEVCRTERDKLGKKVARLSMAHVRVQERCRTLEEHIARLVPSKALPSPAGPDRDDGDDGADDRTA